MLADTAPSDRHRLAIENTDDGRENTDDGRENTDDGRENTDDGHSEMRNEDDNDNSGGGDHGEDGA